jgi:hypothetical protein
MIRVLHPCSGCSLQYCHPGGACFPPYCHAAAGEFRDCHLRAGVFPARQCPYAGLAKWPVDDQTSMDFRFTLMFSMFTTKHFGQKPMWKYLCPQGSVGMIVDLTLISSPSPDGIPSHGTP